MPVGVGPRARGVRVSVMWPSREWTVVSLCCWLVYSMIAAGPVSAQSFQYSRGWGAGKRTGGGAGSGAGAGAVREHIQLLGPLVTNSASDGVQEEPRLRPGQSEMTAADAVVDRLDLAIRALNEQFERYIALKQLVLSAAQRRLQALDSMKARQYAEQSERDELEDLMDLSRAAQQSVAAAVKKA